MSNITYYNVPDQDISGITSPQFHFGHNTKNASVAVSHICNFLYITLQLLKFYVECFVDTDEKETPAMDQKNSR